MKNKDKYLFENEELLQSLLSFEKEVCPTLLDGVNETDKQLIDNIASAMRIDCKIPLYYGDLEYLNQSSLICITTFYSQTTEVKDRVSDIINQLSANKQWGGYDKYVLQVLTSNDSSCLMNEMVAIIEGVAWLNDHIFGVGSDDSLGEKMKLIVIGSR